MASTHSAIPIAVPSDNFTTQAILIGVASGISTGVSMPAVTHAGVPVADAGSYGIMSGGGGDGGRGWGVLQGLGGAGVGGSTADGLVQDWVRVRCALAVAPCTLCQPVQSLTHW